MYDAYTTQVLQDIALFNNRYLGNILADLYGNHPELQDENTDSITYAIESKNNDNVNKLMENAHLSGYPDHLALSDFDIDCLSEKDKQLSEMTLKCCILSIFCMVAEHFFQSMKKQLDRKKRKPIPQLLRLPDNHQP